MLDPWLDAQGLRYPDVEREYAFSIRIGQKKPMVPRSDVVVYRQGQPLLVVEAKAPSNPLTRADEEQVLSYARLLLPRMPPFAVLTNGHSTVVLDTTTGKMADLEWASKGPDCWYTLPREISGDDLNLRFAALQHLISLSVDTLDDFARSQIAEATKHYRHGTGPFRYDPKLHVPRRVISEAFADFRGDDSSLLAIIGGAGSGKTSELLRLADQMVGREFPLYIPLREAQAQPLKFLANAFSWHFAAGRTERELLRDLAGICRRSERRLILLLDEADDCDVEQLRPRLIESFRHVRGLDGWVKILLACHPRTWTSLAKDLAYPTTLGLALSPRAGKRTVRIPDLLGQELQEAYSKLQAEYQLDGELSQAMRSYCSNPTFLRLFAAAYRGRTVPQWMRAGEVLRQFVQWELGRTSDPGGAVRVLHQMARMLASTGNEGTRPARISEHEILKNLPAAGPAHLQVLTRRGLIVREVDQHGRTQVGFSHQWVQNYCVAFLHLELDKCTIETTREMAGDWLRQPVCREAVGWYGDLATDEERKVLYATVEDGARRYLSLWDNALRLVPGLGYRGKAIQLLLVPFPDWAEPAYSHRWVDNRPNHRIVWLALDAALPMDDSIDRALRAAESESTLRWQAKLFVSPDVRESAADEIVEAIRELACNPPAEWFATPRLAGEIAWSIAQTYPGKLQLSQASSTDRQAKRTTLSDDRTIPLSALVEGLELYNAYTYFHDKHHEEMRAHGAASSADLAAEDRVRLERLSREAVADGRRLRSPVKRIGSVLPATTLELMLNLLKEANVPVVAPIVDPGALAPLLRRGTPDSDELAAAGRALCEALDAGTEEYLAIIQERFGGIRDLLEEYDLWRRGPMKLLLFEKPPESWDTDVCLLPGPHREPATLTELILVSRNERPALMSQVLRERRRFVRTTVGALFRPQSMAPLQEDVSSQAEHLTLVRNRVVTMLQDDLLRVEREIRHTLLSS